MSAILTHRTSYFHEAKLISECVFILNDPNFAPARAVDSKPTLVILVIERSEAVKKSTNRLSQPIARTF